MTGDQLFTKQVIAETLTETGTTTSLGFNLPRGKVARIWGLSWNLFDMNLTAGEYRLFVRKTGNSPRQTTPRDNLWAATWNLVVEGSNGASHAHETHIILPKPHRTTGITVQMHSNFNSDARGLLIIYYDIDEMIPGESIEALEKSVLRGRTRRSREFD